MKLIKIGFIQNASGAICGPMDSFLTLRGIKTLHLRMKRHCKNAKKIAHYLKSHSKIEKVFWPGFQNHPNHEIAKKQMKNFKSYLFAILFSVLGGLTSITGYKFFYPENNKNDINFNDNIKLANYVYDTTDFIVPEGLNFIYTSKYFSNIAICNF